MNKERIEQTFTAIDQMIKAHGKKRPEMFGGGKWDCFEEFDIYLEQVGDRYTDLQWTVITAYFNSKTKHLKGGNE